MRYHWRFTRWDIYKS